MRVSCLPRPLPCLRKTLARRRGFPPWLQIVPPNMGMGLPGTGLSALSGALEAGLGPQDENGAAHVTVDGPVI